MSFGEMGVGPGSQLLYRYVVVSRKRVQDLQEGPGGMMDFSKNKEKAQGERNNVDKK